MVEQTPDAQQKLVEQMKPGLDDDLFSNLQSGLWSQEPQTTESESPMNHDEVERSDGMQGEVTSPPLGSSLSPSDYPLEYDGAPNAPVNSSSSDENRASQQNPPPSLADSATTAANEAEKAIAEYLFIEGSTDANLKKTIESLIAVLRYVAANQPQIGSSIEMARHAERVVVMGKVSQQILDELNAAGIPVEQASSSLIEAYRYIEER